MAPSAAASRKPRKKRKELSDEDRVVIVNRLADQSTNGALPRGAQSKIAEEFSVTRGTISLIWNQAVKRHSSSGDYLGVSTADVMKRRAGKGRPSKYDKADVQEKISRLQGTERASIRALAASTDIPRSSLSRMRKRGWFNRSDEDEEEEEDDDDDDDDDDEEQQEEERPQKKTKK